MLDLKYVGECKKKVYTLALTNMEAESIFENMADRYIVCSNRESGYGRYDVMLEPVDKDGKVFVFEFKVI